MSTVLGDWKFGGETVYNLNWALGRDLSTCYLQVYSLHECEYIQSSVGSFHRLLKQIVHVCIDFQ